MYGYIYLTLNLVNSKIYIGQKKSDCYLFKKYLGSGKHFKNAINTYGKDNFITFMLDVAYSKFDLDYKEIYWIKKLDSTNPQKGYNISKGGNTPSGIAVWNKGLTKEVDNRLKQSIETKNKRSASLKKAYAEGRHKTVLSEESRKVMSEKAKKRAHPPTTSNTQCFTNGILNKMLKPNEIDEYLKLGWWKGKTMKSVVAWNKGLTKDTDERVAKMHITRNVHFTNGESIGFCGCKGNKFHAGQKVKEYNSIK